MVNTREKFLVTAERLADQRGPRGYGLDAVLSEVGVSKTTFYKYFDTKDQLSIEVINRCADQLASEIEDELSQRFANDAHTCLRNILPIWLRKIREKNWNGCLFSKFCHAYPDQQDEIYAIARRFPEAVRHLIERYCRDLGGTNQDHLARQLMIVLQGAATYEFMFRADKQNSIADDAQVVIAMLVDANR